jgi:hypothetical protein
MAANTPITNLSTKAQEGIVQFYRSCASITSATWNIREQMLQIDKLYMRELDRTMEDAKAKLANASGDPTKFQNVTVPIVMPAVEAAVTYQTSVFLTGVPLFGVSSTAANADAALQMESIIDHQAIRGGWARELQLLFRDGFKYNFGAAEVTWAQEKIFTPETNLNFSPTQAEPVQVSWEGNKLKRLDPYNIIFDARYKPTEISERGEFAGYTDMLSHIELRAFMHELPYRMNSKQAYESQPAAIGNAFPYDYYIPQLNPTALLDQRAFASVDWLAWAGLSERKTNINFKNTYFRTTLYARIVPADFGISSPAAHIPQIWKFIIINHSVIIYAERQTNAHNRIPLLFIQPLEDGLGYQTKSLARNSEPFQSVGSALLNSAIAARRRAISDRGIYDPTRIDAKQINNDSASAKIPVKPAAYGKPLGESYYPIPFRDEQSAQAMSDLQFMYRMNEQVTGQNQAQQGQFVKGNKTLFEYQDIMSNANGRSQTISILLETQFFTPLKELLKLNILQYQQSEEVFNREIEEVVEVDPVSLRQATLEFKVSDGLVPASKQMNTEAFQSAVQTIAAVPQLADAYNIGPMFSYLFKSQRADVAQFEKSPQEIQYNQALAQWQQAVATLAAELHKMEGITPEQMQELLPPQPMPEQFGLSPEGAPPPPKQSLSILQQVVANNADSQS